jgi:archaellum component FlaF (FlaF/FlaG flagellin family)
MKKILITIAALGISTALVFVACTKKAEDVKPQPIPQPAELKVGSLRIAANDSQLRISNTEATSSESISSITIYSNGSVTITKIGIVGGGTSSTTISKIAVTPSDKSSAAIGGTRCLTLSEAELFIGRLDGENITQEDLCKVLDILKCILENPSDYGLSSSDVKNTDFLDVEQLAAFCNIIKCSSCSAITSALATNPTPKSTFSFRGSEYSGRGSCSTSSSSYTSYSVYSDNDNDNYLSYSKSSGYESISLGIDGTSYFSSSKDSITVNKDGNTVTISGKVRKSGSSSTSNTTYDVSATIICE